MKKLLLAFFLFSNQNLFSADVPVTFNDPEKYNRYHRLITEIRCLVCQNQSLADSHAELAQDLRNEIVAMIDKGRTNDEIIQFVVDRYGDFVLYRTPLKKHTLLLWFGPLIFFVIALIMLFRFIRKQTPKPDNIKHTTKQQLSDS